MSIVWWTDSLLHLCWFLFVCCKCLFVMFFYCSGPSAPNLEVSIPISDWEGVKLSVPTLTNCDWWPLRPSPLPHLRPICCRSLLRPSYQHLKWQRNKRQKKLTRIANDDNIIMRIANDYCNDYHDPFHNGDTNWIITGSAAWEHVAASSILPKCIWCNRPPSIPTHPPSPCLNINLLCKLGG